MTYPIWGPQEHILCITWPCRAFLANTRACCLSSSTVAPVLVTPSGSQMSTEQMTVSCHFFLPLESAAAEPTSAANSTSAAAAGRAAATAAAAAEQHPNQWDGRGHGCGRRGRGCRTPAQPGLQPQPGASKQETTHRAFRR